MVIAGRRIQEFIAGQDFAEFSTDLKTSRRHPADPDPHHYEGTDPQEVWKAVSRRSGSPGDSGTAGSQA
jgi:uncharacterized protein with HEPN domain